MQETKLEVGAIFEGKVTGITKFGAFIELPGGKTGMRTADPRARTTITAAKLLPRCRAPQDRAIMSGARAKTPALLKI